MRITSTFVDGQRHLSGTNTHARAHTPRSCPADVRYIRPMHNKSTRAERAEREHARYLRLVLDVECGTQTARMHFESSGNFEDGARHVSLSWRVCVCPLARRESSSVQDIDIQPLFSRWSNLHRPIFANSFLASGAQVERVKSSEIEYFRMSVSLSLSLSLSLFLSPSV